MSTPCLSTIAACPTGAILPHRLKGVKEIKAIFKKSHFYEKHEKPETKEKP